MASVGLLLLFSSCQTTEPIDTGGEKNSLYYEALLNEEENREIRYNLLYTLYEEGDYEKVIELSKEAISLYPEYTRFLKIMALSYREIKNDELYSNTLSSITEKEGYDEELRDLYLESLILLGKEEEAISFSKETLRLFPENKKALEILGKESPFYSYILTLKDSSESQV